MLKTTDVLKAVTGELIKKYNYPVYSREVVKGFKQPCFFIKFMRTTTGETQNFNSNTMSVFITYFASAEKNREIEFMRIIDDLRQIFGMSIQAGGRNLKTRTFNDERVGEKQDILQVTITTDFFDDTGRADPDAGLDVMRELKTKITNRLAY